MAKCCICDELIEREDAPVLAMGGAGYPRLLCDRCASLLDTATLGRDFDEIKDAIGEIGTIMADHDPDGVTYRIVSSLMIDASERAKAIKEGSYDFALDEDQTCEGYDELPEELRETEEDAELDRRDAESAKKFDKVLNWLWVGVFAGVIILFLLKFVFHVI